MESEKGEINFTVYNVIGKIISTECAQVDTRTQGECLGALLILKKIVFIKLFLTIENAQKAATNIQ